ncbi:hypothetical protein SAMN04488063_1311 [Halopelagius inordinatus]|uniref:Uncharacterized protein n=1 Tax=Halopelagius inordinatus TaxID=553467 RepID=A0A1I2NSA7_9EURY|nr:hypothetical protein [Halopelagius inordinatus]SFG06473.1 hypothetical protein SAMN04488063_1311 [Halopelagius inordinatus]
MTDRTYVTPDELDFTEDDSVRELGDDRYVVAVDGDGGRPEAAAEPGRRAVEERASTDDESSDSDRYYLELGARTDVAEDETVVAGDDIGAVFADALRWYARRVAPSERPQKVVNVLLSDTEFAVTDRVRDR